MEPALLPLLRTLAPLEVIEVDGAAVLAAAHPGLAPAGTLSAPWGDPAAAPAAIAAGEAWLRARGCLQVLAPMEVCTWFAYRANLGPHDIAPFPREPVADPASWRAAGYAERARYSSVFVEHAPLLARFAGAEERVRRAGFTVRPMDPARFEEDLRSAWRISLAAFQRAFAFVPLPWEAFRALYAPIQQLDSRLTGLISDREGEAVGYYLNLPGPVASGGPIVVYKTLAILPRVQRQHLGAAMTARGHRIAAELGLTGGAIHALMDEEGASPFFGAEGATISREYALFGKDLGGLGA